MKQALAVVVVQLAMGAGWAIADSDPSLQTLRTCAAEDDATRRLACYDSAMGRQERNERATPGSSTPTPSETAVNDPSKFGYRGAIAREEADRRKAERLDELSGVVTEVAKLAHGEYVVTLDNGQVWQQLSANSRIRIDVGDRVTVKAAALGSFTLVTVSGTGTKVTRKR